MRPRRSRHGRIEEIEMKGLIQGVSVSRKIWEEKRDEKKKDWKA